MKFLNRRVRITKDPAHQEYDVVGVNWKTEELMLLGDAANFWCDHKLVDLIPEEDIP